MQVRYDFYFLWNFAHLIFIFTRSANWNVISPVQVFSISSIVRQVDKFSTRRGVGQLKLFVVTVTIFLFSRFCSVRVQWQMFHRFSITNNAVLSEFNWKTTILKGGNKRPFKDLKICLVVQFDRSMVLPVGCIKLHSYSVSWINTLIICLHRAV